MSSCGSYSTSYSHGPCAPSSHASAQCQQAFQSFQCNQSSYSCHYTQTHYDCHQPTPPVTVLTLANEFAQSMGVGVQGTVGCDVHPGATQVAAWEALTPTLPDGAYDLGAVNGTTAVLGAAAGDSLTVDAGDSNTLIVGDGDGDSLNVLGTGDHNVLFAGNGDGDSLLVSMGDQNVLYTGNGDGNNIIVGTGNDNDLHTGDGNGSFLLVGTGDHNCVDVGNGDGNTLEVGSGTSNGLIAGTGDGNTLMMGTGDNNLLSVGDGANNQLSVFTAGDHNTLAAGNGDGDMLFVGSGDYNFLHSGNGAADQITFGTGDMNALIAGNGASDFVHLGTGDGNILAVGDGAGDTLGFDSGSSNILLDGNGLNDTLNVGSGDGNVAIIGNGNGDQAWGAEGNNNSYLTGAGNDLVHTGGGNDFVYVDNHTETSDPNDPYHLTSTDSLAQNLYADAGNDTFAIQGAVINTSHSCGSYSFGNCYSQAVTFQCGSQSYGCDSNGNVTPLGTTVMTGGHFVDNPDGTQTYVTGVEKYWVDGAFGNAVITDFNSANGDRVMVGGVWDGTNSTLASLGPIHTQYITSAYDPAGQAAGQDLLITFGSNSATQGSITLIDFLPQDTGGAHGAEQFNNVTFNNPVAAESTLAHIFDFSQADNQAVTNQVASLAAANLILH